jgi:hypothetical protein
VVFSSSADWLIHVISKGYKPSYASWRHFGPNKRFLQEHCRLRVPSRNTMQMVRLTFRDSCCGNRTCSTIRGARVITRRFLSRRGNISLPERWVPAFRSSRCGLVRSRHFFTRYLGRALARGTNPCLSAIGSGFG